MDFFGAKPWNGCGVMPGSARKAAAGALHESLMQRKLGALLMAMTVVS
jgi:hypothetical protein